MPITKLNLLLWLGLSAAALLLSCDSSATPDRIIVVVDGDVQVDRVRLRVFDRAGDEDASVDEDIQVSLQPDGRKTFALPLSFALERQVADKPTPFRLVVTGYRGDDAVIEQQASNQFRGNKSLRLDVFLMSACEHVFCPSAAGQRPSSQHCSFETGRCESFPDGEILPEVDQSMALAGYDGKLPEPPPPIAPPAPRPSKACARCSLPDAYPCVQSAFDPENYSCTGQYADWPMPDSTPGASTAPAYQSVAPGVVRDQVTELLWQSAVPSAYEGCPNPAAPSASRCSVAQAKAYCAQLSLGGVKWRLPSALELQTIFSGNHAPPYIDLEAFPDTPSARFLTASPYVAQSGRFWTRDFGPAVQSAYVRCVSSSNADPETAAGGFGWEFGDGGQRRTSQETGLSWDDDGYVNTYDWQDAQELCAFRGMGDRLPTLNELISIVDFARSAPALDVEHFDFDPAEPFWTASSLSEGGKLRVWLVDFADGTPRLADPSERHWVRCVRRFTSWGAPTEP